MSEELIEKAYESIELAKTTGKLKKGVNEVTKSIERVNAKLVVYAGDINPKEIIMHLPMLSKEKEIPCIEVPSKDDLGAAAGLPVGTTAVAIVQPGEAKKNIAEIEKSLGLEK